MAFITMYAVRSRLDRSLYRSRHESYTRGQPFAEAQLWSNPKTAAKEARYQEERRAWSEEHVRNGVHKALSYMGPCEVVEVRIEEPK